MSLGLVDYISEPGTSGYDRSLVLAQKIASNGECLHSSMC